MPTGDKRANIYNKRNMPQEAWDLHFFRFLDDKINDTTRAAFLQSGVLGDDYIGLTGPAADIFDLDITLEDRVMDGYGHIIDLGNWFSEYGATSLQSYFENANGVTYYVGIRYQESANDVERNPRSSEPEYPWYKDIIGEKGTPDNVTDNGTYIRLEIDGILENGVDHSRRPVWVYLINPVSPDDSVAYYTSGVVGYSGGVNYIDIPYTPTIGPLGQTAPSYTISTDPLDYQVIVPGVSWFRNTDISTDNNYAFIGTVTGAGTGVAPTIFNTSNQRPVFLISLDRAYRANSPDDPAPGRTIYADKKAVRIKQSATSTGAEDWINEALRIDQMDQSGAFVSRGLSVWNGFLDTGGIASPISNMLQLSDGIGNDLQPSERFNVTSAGATITFTRVGVDLTTQFTPWLNEGGAIVKLTGTASGTWDGFYWYSAGSVTVNTLDLMYADFTPVAFPIGISGYVHIYHPVWWGFLTDWVGSAAASNMISQQLSYPAYMHGFEVDAFGDIVDPGVSTLFRLGNQDGTDSNRFASWYPGRLRMSGGGDIGSYPTTDGNVVGHAQYTSDKTDTGFATDWTPDEEKAEWGFDYRGSSWGNDSSTDVPAHQLGFTFRHPMWRYDSGTDDFRKSELFNYQTAGNTLNFTRVGFDNTDMPFGNTYNQNIVLCELEFASPYEAYNGIYFATEKVTSTQIRFEKIDGTNPGFNPAVTGTCRFWGGVFVGSMTTDELSGAKDGFLMHLVQPVSGMGGMRYCHSTDDSISSPTAGTWGIWMTNRDNPMFGVRDGGFTFARALTTKTPFTGSGLTQWDQISTSLYTGDLAQIDLAQITEIELDEGTYDLLLPTTLANCDVVARNGGGTWTVVRHQNLFNFSCPANGGSPTWHTPLGSARITALYGNYEAKVPLKLLQNSVLTSITVYVDATTGDGTSASFGLDVLRKAFTDTTSTSLSSTGRAYTSTSGLHQFSITLDQNNTVDNVSYTYWIELIPSDTGGDEVYTARSGCTVTRIGESWFD